MTDMPPIPEAAIEAAAKAVYDREKWDTTWESEVGWHAEYREAALAALTAARPHLGCSCPHISEVDDWCPQHGHAE